MIRGSVVGDHETRIPIRTEISRQDAEPGPTRGGEASRGSDIFKPSVPQVVKELCNRSSEGLRSAIVSSALRRKAVPRIELHIMHHRQIQVAVAIVIEERCAG